MSPPFLRMLTELFYICCKDRVPEDLEGQATFLAKADGVLAGLAVADLVFSTVDPCLSVSWSGKDGDHIKSGTKFGVVKGSARSILVAERIALNFMQRMSGIATATAAMTDRMQASTPPSESGPLCRKPPQGTSARILETRKTAPGLRLPDKWAVLIGGGKNHRIGLFDMVMIKDNHVTSAGGVVPAIQHAQDFVRRKHKNIPIEVETRTLEEVKEVLQFLESDKHSLVKRLMLDNMTKLDSSAPGGVDVSMLKEAVKLVNGRVDTEASGNVTIDTVKAIAQTGVTYISCGALTHSFQALDISLKIAILD
ncbi:MAG: Nicotinate-nucleotide pyrophosphorylase [carboxylating] [Trebouxia sp. A1-2]|nr:MAG: Nicotinate-nucleotide pyrophosphorylase [carboxylating] [Trebouxia sp. A1-2]